MNTNIQARNNRRFRQLATGAAIAILMLGDVQANETNTLPAPAQNQLPYELHRGKFGTGGEWKEPDKVLSQIVYEGLPIAEVAEDLKRMFQNDFDVLYPNASGLPSGRAPWNWRDVSIELRLKNVRASEIFNAMNLMFETGKTPLRWELLMNGQRSTALLRDLSDLSPPEITIDPTTGLPMPTVRAVNPMVFFVGDLVGDPKAGGMSMDQVVQTVSTVCASALRIHEISSHKEAQLLIIRGTNEEIQFVQATLKAMREKSQLDAERQSRLKVPDLKPKANETSTR